MIINYAGACIHTNHQSQTCEDRNRFNLAIMLSVNKKFKKYRIENSYSIGFYALNISKQCARIIWLGWNRKLWFSKFH